MWPEPAACSARHVSRLIWSARSRRPSSSASLLLTLPAPSAASPRRAIIPGGAQFLSAPIGTNLPPWGRKETPPPSAADIEHIADREYRRIPAFLREKVTR